MLKGDLASTPLAPLLLQLAEDVSTGCLHISDAEGDEALIYYKNGLVYAVSVPGRRPQLGAKLVSSGALGPEALADALEAQRTELQGWRLGELLVHLGYVDQPVVEAFIKEQMHDALWDLIKWVEGHWRFRKIEKTREDVAPPMAVAELLQDLRDRGAEWANISTIVHGPTAVPVLSTRAGASGETMLDADAWSMLCKIDGERSLAELARDCGYTMFEAGQVVVALVNAGLVDIEEDVDVEPAKGRPDEGDELYGAQSVRSALAADAQADVASYASSSDDNFAALARLVSEVAAGVRDEEPLSETDTASVASPAPEPEPAVVVPLQQQRARFNAGNDQSFAASIERVSAALNDVLGPASSAPDPYAVPEDLRVRGNAPRERSEDEERKTRARQAAAAELAAAHALAEALRAAQAEEAAAAHAGQADVAEVVDLAAVRREAEAERIAAEEAARVEAERLAAEEAARVDAERLAAEEAARLEAERLEAERAAEEAARADEERTAGEAAARAEAAAERRRARRRAAREAARVEAERLAAEETARVEAERVAAEEAERAEAERAEAERVEAERVAAEEAARLEVERAEAERVAAEEAARLEVERAEAERVAAEEAERAEAERAEAERVAHERAEAEDEAWAEYWAREAQAADVAAEATSLLVALSAEPLTPAAEPEPQPEPEREPLTEETELPAPMREPATVGGRSGQMNEMADTAALLRELSSLGLDDEPPAAPATTGPPRTVRPPTPEKKKKRGLFGF